MTALIILCLFTTHTVPAEAVASWYGEDFHGRLTSCGEVFDMWCPHTFAHKELPPGSLVRVTFTGEIDGQTVHNSRLALGNDDGPYYGDREFDLSYSLFCVLTDSQPELGVIHIQWEVVGYKPRDTMQWNRYGTGEYADLFRDEITAFIAEPESRRKKVVRVLGFLEVRAARVDPRG